LLSLAASVFSSRGTRAAERGETKKAAGLYYVVLLLSRLLSTRGVFLASFFFAPLSSRDVPPPPFLCHFFGPPAFFFFTRVSPPNHPFLGAPLGLFPRVVLFLPRPSGWPAPPPVLRNGAFFFDPSGSPRNPELGPPRLRPPLVPGTLPGFPRGRFTGPISPPPTGPNPLPKVCALLGPSGPLPMAPISPPVSQSTPIPFRGRIPLRQTGEVQKTHGTFGPSGEKPLRPPRFIPRTLAQGCPP